LFFVEILINKTHEMIVNKASIDSIIMEKDRIINRFYQQQEKLLKKIWLNE
jgi:hypothetical protein